MLRSFRLCSKNYIKFLRVISFSIIFFCYKIEILKKNFRYRNFDFSLGEIINIIVERMAHEIFQKILNLKISG